MSSRFYSSSGKSLRLQIPRRYVMLCILTTAYALSQFHRLLMAAIGTNLMADFDINATQLGLLGSLYFYAYAVMQIPVGIAVDHWGPRRLVSVFSLIAALGSLTFALAPSYAFLAIGRFLIGLGVSSTFLCGLALILAWFPVKDAALWNGIFIGLASIGNLLAGRPLIELSEAIGWSGAFFISAGLLALISAGVWFLVRDAPERARSEPPAEHKTFSIAELLSDIGTVMRNPLIWLTSAGAFLLAGSQLTFQAVWAGPFLRDVYAVSPAVIGNMLLLIPIGRILGNLTQGWLVDRVFNSRVTAIFIGMAGTAVAWLMLAAATANMGQVELGAVYGGGFGYLAASFMLIFPILRSSFSPGIASTAIGIVNLFTMLGGAIIQQLFGVLLDRYAPVDGIYPVDAYQLAFRVGLGLAVAGLLLWAVALRPQKGGRTPLPVA